MNSYLNLLNYNHCKPLTCFCHLLWPWSGSCFYEEYITNTTKPMYKHKILSFKYVIHNLCYNIKYMYNYLCYSYLNKKCSCAICMSYQRQSRVVVVVLCLLAA